MISLSFVGAQVLRGDDLTVDTLSISNGLIVDERQSREIDLTGFQIFPGIVDAHGDGFERHLAPRRGAMRDLSLGLMSTEAELAVNGITTAFLAQFWSWEGGMRGPEFAARFLDAMAGYRGHTDMRVQLRFETHMIADYADVEAAVAQYGIPYVVFNNHLPIQALSQGKTPPRMTGQALKAGRNPQAHLAAMTALFETKDQVPAAVSGLATRLLQRGVRLGSHDDQTADDRQFWGGAGVAISEFPETVEAAKMARDQGDRVVLGAPNVVRGGSHSGNASAGELVSLGLCDALASDYHYPAPKQAALLLAETVGIAAAWHLISKGPAEVLGLADRGELITGKRADLVVLDANGRVCATVAAGHFTHINGSIAERIFG